MDDKQLFILAEEIRDDPTGAGYDSMTAQEVVDSLMATNKASAVQVLAGNQIGRLFDVGEFKALDADARSTLQAIWQLPIVPVADGFYRAFLLDAFKEQSTSWTNLSAILTRAVSRAAELGLPEKIGAHHVEEARKLLAVKGE